MSRVLVLGAGQQGRLIGDILSKNGDNNREVVYADNANKANIKIDLSKKSNIEKLIKENKFSLAIGALPSSLGYQAFKTCLENGLSIVDISFFSENPYEGIDVASGTFGFVDCGVAPGLTNFMVGYLLDVKNPKKIFDFIDIYVGGVAQNKNEPLGYSLTWSLDDLFEDYIREARIISNHEEKAVKPFKTLSRLDLFYDKFEAFCTDGLRTLLKYKDRATFMTEQTIRWPGHVKAVKPFVKKGKEVFVNHLKSRCINTEDLLLFQIYYRVKGQPSERLFMHCKMQDNISAMSRATGYTCAAIVEHVFQAQKFYKSQEKRIYAPEDICSLCWLHDYNVDILQFLKNNDISFNHISPLINDDK